MSARAFERLRFLLVLLALAWVCNGFGQLLALAWLSTLDAAPADAPACEAPAWRCA